MKIILKNHGTTDSVGFWVWVGFCPKPDFFYGFFILKFISTEQPDPTRFLGWIEWV
jgi:hypothetical protein